MKLKQRVSIQEEMYVCVMAETIEDPAVSDNSMWLVALSSCDLFFYPQGLLGSGKTLPRTHLFLRS